MTSTAGTRVLVTGATGRIGRHVVSELIARGYYVRALTSKRVLDSEVFERLEWRQVDFQESPDFDAAVQGCGAVLHLGAEITVVDRMQRSNVEATRALAEASERAGVKVFCYTSSVAVYGSSRRRRVLEDSPVLSADQDVPREYWVNTELRHYGRTKLQSELALQAVARDVEYVILRPTVVVDVRDLLELQTWSKARKQRAGSRHAHHIYVHDVADAILWFMERSLRRDLASPGLSTFNLSDDDTPVNTYGEIFQAAYEISGDRRWRTKAVPWPVEWLWALFKFRTLRSRHSFGRMRFANDKLTAEGYEFRFGMSHAVSVFLNELRSQ
jgi:nucleoside-diphosphate-sugar epimerase